jgi:hypothetical protein
VIARSSESGVEFLFVEIKLHNRVVLLATICRPPNTSGVYHSLDGDYGLQAERGLVGITTILGDFNVDLLDPFCWSFFVSKVLGILGDDYVMHCGYFSDERSVWQALSVNLDPQRKLYQNLRGLGLS